MRKTLNYLFTILLLPSFCFALSNCYTIKDLGTLQSDYSEACWINENGEVLGKYKLGTETSVFLWSTNQGLRVLDLPIDTKSCKDIALKKINNRGQVLGIHYDAVNKPLAFFWDPTLGFQEITIAGAQSVGVSDMNDKGEVVGIFHRGDKSYAFLWKNGKIVELENLYGDLGIAAAATNALCINNNSDIGGYVRKTIVYKGKIYGTVDSAVVWTAACGWKVCELFPENYSETKITALNDSGNYICHCSTTGAKMRNLFNNTCIPVPNSDIKCFTNNNIYVNNLNLIEVANKSNVYLRQSIKTNNLPNSFWTNLVTVSAINSKRVAVGTAKNYFGETHAILLVPIN